MKSRAFNFVIYFSVLFALNLIVNFFFKENLNTLTAFSVALGVSLGIVYLGPLLVKR